MVLDSGDKVVVSERGVERMKGLMEDVEEKRGRSQEDGRMAILIWCSEMYHPKVTHIQIRWDAKHSPFPDVVGTGGFQGASD